MHATGCVRASCVSGFGLCFEFPSFGEREALFGARLALYQLISNTVLIVAN